MDRQIYVNNMRFLLAKLNEEDNEMILTFCQCYEEIKIEVIDVSSIPPLNKLFKVLHTLIELQQYLVIAAQMWFDN